MVYFHLSLRRRCICRVGIGVEAWLCSSCETWPRWPCDDWIAWMYRFPSFPSCRAVSISTAAKSFALAGRTEVWKGGSLTIFIFSERGVKMARRQWKGAEDGAIFLEKKNNRPSPHTVALQFLHRNRSSCWLANDITLLHYLLIIHYWQPNTSSITLKQWCADFCFAW